MRQILTDCQYYSIEELAPRPTFKQVQSALMHMATTSSTNNTYTIFNTGHGAKKIVRPKSGSDNTDEAGQLYDGIFSEEDMCEILKLFPARTTVNLVYNTCFANEFHREFCSHINAESGTNPYRVLRTGEWNIQACVRVFTASLEHQLAYVHPGTGRSVFMEAMHQVWNTNERPATYTDFFTAIAQQPFMSYRQQPQHYFIGPAHCDCHVLKPFH